MDILVIGNGFDIAHGLDTRYIDFLEYCKHYTEKGPIWKDSGLSEEFSDIIKDNVWLDYFNSAEAMQVKGENWIDFERNICDFIDLLDKANVNVERNRRSGKANLVYNLFDMDPQMAELKAIISVLAPIEITEGVYAFKQQEIIDNKTFVTFLYQQLRELTRAFEIYCVGVNDKKVPNMIKKKFDGVLSFNYTDTYERLYGNEHTKYCYIHGKAQKDKNNTDLILGINDTLENGGRDDEDFKWVRFKKYYQRILFKTGSEYKNWLVTRDKKDLSGPRNIYIIGHSLGTTDFEILYELFNAPNFRITVYYYSESDFEEKIQRVIQILGYKGRNGRDELINRVHGDDWSIRFVDQYDEKDGLFIQL